MKTLIGLLAAAAVAGPALLAGATLAAPKAPAAKAGDPALAAARKLGTPAKGPVVKTKSGLRYIDIKVGKGKTPKPTDTVTVNYTGWLVNGTKFDSSKDHGKPISFPLNRVIPGWTEGVGSMKVGGLRKLIIPSDLGYGPNGMPPTIPGGATLIFEVELLKIN